jgi:hypothetical protein
MKPALILTAVFVPLMVVYMAFLAQRDQKLFDRYDSVQQLEQRPQSTFTPTEQFCKSRAGSRHWHPDCNVE